MYYHDAFEANNTVLPDFYGLPLLDWSEPTDFPNPTCPHVPSGLTAGGRLVFQRTRRPVSTCNLLATVAGIGQEHDHAQ